VSTDARAPLHAGVWQRFESNNLHEIRRVQPRHMIRMIDVEARGCQSLHSIDVHSLVQLGDALRSRA